MSVRTSFGGGIITLLAVAWWMAGLVLAKGAWMTTFALFPLYAWYLVVERVMLNYGVF